ncbi:MAG: phosphopantothenoylcysteine decarboxylase [Planctomycetes bacterium]|nr:phosphopantothenoylcysteine decarboxylase [Planctomycetota bacterium]
MTSKPSILITAGPTHEPVDAVRYIANRSSGRMGIALAEAAASRGSSVTLLLGPTPSAPPHHSQIRVRRFRTTADLQGLLADLWPEHSILIMAAAVADYRPSKPADHMEKRPRQQGRWTLELEATPDLLAEAAAASRPDQVTVGFALGPPDRLLDTARDKLRAKHIDAIVANGLRTMGDDRIQATLILRDGREISRPECPKREFADWLLEQVELLRVGR